ncbi:hypothetical protein U1Q18_038289 [Sarracenia purpurea var. burkii]
MCSRQWSFLTKMAASFCLGATSNIATTMANNSMYTVDGGQYAVIFDSSRGVINETVGERTHFLIPGLQRAFIFNIRTRPHTSVTVSCTKDLQMVGLTLHVLYSPEVVVAQVQADELLIHSTRVSALQEVLRSKFMVAKAKQELRATIIKAEGESKLAKLIRDVTSAVEMDWIEFKRIEASKQIAATLVKNPNVVWKKYP